MRHMPAAGSGTRGVEQRQYAKPAHPTSSSCASAARPSCADSAPFNSQSLQNCKLGSPILRGFSSFLMRSFSSKFCSSLLSGD